MTFHRSIAGSCYKFPGVERVSKRRAAASTDALSDILREFSQMSSRRSKVVELTVSTHAGLGQVQVTGFGIRHSF